MEAGAQPEPPAPRVVLIGSMPVTEAMTRLAPELGLETVMVTDGGAEPSGADLALVAASHRPDELPALRGALAAGVPYVGLVASRRRGAAVLGELRAGGVPEEALERVDTPAGFDIGAKTPGEIALAILARIVEVRRTQVAPVGPTT
jgi:xanthine dehydrogenase accessory factor